MASIHAARLLEPWAEVDEADALRLEAQLARELSRGHELEGKRVRAIARRIDADDVLFALDGAGCAEVHLTWSGKPEAPGFPHTESFDSLEAWYEQRMRPDHAEYAE